MMDLYNQLVNRETKLSLIGLGYVGMPIAVAFAKKVDVIGFDLNADKIALYKQGIDPTHEEGDDVIRRTTVDFTSDPARLREARFTGTGWAASASYRSRTAASSDSASPAPDSSTAAAIQACKPMNNIPIAPASYAFPANGNERIIKIFFLFSFFYVFFSLILTLLLKIIS